MVKQRLIVGLAVSLTFSVVELIVFMTGITMFHHSLSIMSVFCHGAASVALAQSALTGWLCDWYWWIFAFCDAVPFLNNVFVTVVALVCR